jgi:hypothetical protein
LPCQYGCHGDRKNIFSPLKETRRKCWWYRRAFNNNCIRPYMRGMEFLMKTFLWERCCAGYSRGERRDIEGLTKSASCKRLLSKEIGFCPELKGNRK